METEEMTETETQCPECDGTGSIEIAMGPETDSKECLNCKGTGLVSENDLLLSICMIVGKEEVNLKRCLDSLLPVIHEKWCELIIVVTQEGDSTLELAKEYTDKVYFQKWQNDFSFHRNFSTSKAKGKKILIVDADEELTQRSLYILENAVWYNEGRTVFFNIKSYYDKEFKQYADMLQPRMFMNDGNPIYDGVVHNKPRCTEPFSFMETIELNHYGYQFDGNEELKTQKNDRSLPLLESAYLEKPDDLHVLTHLLKTYFVANNMDKVKEYGEKWIVLMQAALDSGAYHEGWAAFLENFEKLAACYVASDDIENALRIKTEAEKFSKHLSTIYFNIGYWYSAHDNDAICAEYLELGLKMADENKNPYSRLMTSNIKMIVPEIMNWLAIYYFRIGNFDRAGQYHNRGILLNENRRPLRWDVWNEPRCVNRLIYGEILIPIASPDMGEIPEEENEEEENEPVLNQEP